ncbi:MAG: hypothetical protein JSS99_08730 [Actinobacteria bacterium]|nr:hypothetical protein [Actinomycetota bacterium]
MTYTSDEGRRELLAATAEAADTIAVVLAALGEAYELVDEDTAERLEAELFGPAQAAYGRMKRGHVEFAARSGLPTASFAVAQPPAPPSAGAHGYVEAAIEAAEHADDILSELQDSLLPVEVGDAELRAAIADVRTRLSAVPEAGHALLRTLGR